LTLMNSVMISDAGSGYRQAELRRRYVYAAISRRLKMLPPYWLHVAPEMRQPLFVYGGKTYDLFSQMSSRPSFELTSGSLIQER
jgi:hypothetical protein